MSEKRLYEYNNNNNGKRYHFYMHDQVDWDSELFEQMTTMREASPDDIVHIHINGHGGSVSVGAQYIAAMRSSKATIVTYNEGLAASMFALIFLAGDYSVPCEHSSLMLHEMRVGMGATASSDVLRTVTHMQRGFRSLYDSVVKDFTSEEEDEKIFSTGFDHYFDSEEQVERLGPKAVVPEDEEDTIEPFIITVDIAKCLTDSPEMAELTRLSTIVNAEIISRINAKVHGSVFLLLPSSNSDLVDILKDMLDEAEMDDVSVNFINNHMSIMFKIPE